MHKLLAKQLFHYVSESPQDSQIIIIIIIINCIYYIGGAEGHEYPDLQVGDEVNPRLFFWGSNPWSNDNFFQSVGNVTVDTIKHYKKGFQMKPNAELQLCGQGDSGN